MTAQIAHNVRVYEQLRCRCADLSRYNLRNLKSKPSLTLNQQLVIHAVVSSFNQEASAIFLLMVQALFQSWPKLFHLLSDNSHEQEYDAYQLYRPIQQKYA